MIDTLAFRKFEQPDGTLIPIEFANELPFIPKRIFWIYGIPTGMERGGHAHKECQQMIFTVAGSCTAQYMNVDDERYTLGRLMRGNLGLYVSPMTWLILKDITKDAVILVLASHAYDTADYINNYADFRRCRVA